MRNWLNRKNSENWQKGYFLTYFVQKKPKFWCYFQHPFNRNGIWKTKSNTGSTYDFDTILRARVWVCGITGIVLISFRGLVLYQRCNRKRIFFSVVLFHFFVSLGKCLREFFLERKVLRVWFCSQVDRFWPDLGARGRRDGHAIRLGRPKRHPHHVSVSFLSRNLPITIIRLFNEFIKSRKERNDSFLT